MTQGSAASGSQRRPTERVGFERVRIGGEPNRGVVTVACRTQGNGPTRVEVFALDPDSPDAAYTGVELIDRGNSVAGFVVYEGRPPRQWSAPH